MVIVDELIYVRLVRVICNYVTAILIAVCCCHCSSKYVNKVGSRNLRLILIYLVQYSSYFNMVAAEKFCVNA